MERAGNQGGRIRLRVQLKLELEIVKLQARTSSVPEKIQVKIQVETGDSMRERKRVQSQVSEKSVKARLQSKAKRADTAYARVEQQKYDWLEAQAELRRQSIVPRD